METLFEKNRSGIASMAYLQEEVLLPDDFLPVVPFKTLSINDLQAARDSLESGIGACVAWCQMSGHGVYTLDELKQIKHKPPHVSNLINMLRAQESLQHEINKRIKNAQGTTRL